MASKKKLKKATKKELQKSLADQFLQVVKDLGHNAELIADDIAKASKQAAKKLAKTAHKVKEAAVHVVEDLTHKEKATKKPAKVAVSKKVVKTVKKATRARKPSASVKVEGINSVEKAEAAIRKEPSKTTAKPPTLKTKSPAAVSTSTKKSVVKSVANNPVERVQASKIPNQPKTSGTAKRNTK